MKRNILILSVALSLMLPISVGATEMVVSTEVHPLTVMKTFYHDGMLK